MPDETQTDETLRILLHELPAPRVNPEQKAKLHALLLQEMPEQKTVLARLQEWYPLAVLISQIRIIRREIWPASALILGLGVILTLVSDSPDGLTFTALAPIVAAVGVALLYDQNAQMMLEIEETTLASTRQLMLARLTLVFGFNFILALASSVILSLFSDQIVLSSLVFSWLAPMSFLSALAFFLSIFLFDPFASAVFSLFLWVLNLISRNMTIENDWLSLLSIPGLSAPINRPLLMGAAAILLVSALWIIGVRETRFGKHVS